MKGLMKFEGNDVKIIIENGGPLFELYSTGMALGYSKSNKIKDKVYYQCRKDRVDKVCQSAEITLLVHSGLKFLTEDQLYDFMLEARTEKCKEFRKWVTKDVLPSIRKHGMYATKDKIEEMLADPDTMIMTLQALKKERIAKEIAQKDADEKQKVIEYQKPRVDFANAISVADDAVDLGTFAKVLSNNDFKIGRNKLFEILRDKKIIQKTNIPYQRYVNNGWFTVSENPYNDPFGTPKISYKTMITPVGQIKIEKGLRKLLSNNTNY